jgi:type II secretory pathway component PulC
MSKNRESGDQVIGLSAVVAVVTIFVLSVVAFAEDQQFVYDSKSKRNPFIPLITEDGRLVKLDKVEVPSGDVTVEGIIFDKKGRSYAIVNGTVVGIGDAIAGYEVLKIQSDKVLFIKDGQIRELEMHKEGE